MVWGHVMRVPVNGLCLVFAAEVGRTGLARSPSTQDLWSDKWLTPTPQRMTRSSTPCRTGGAARAGLTRWCQHLPQAGEQGCAGLLDLSNACMGWGSQDLALSSHGPHQIFISTSLIWHWGITCAHNGSDLELCLLMPVQQKPGDELVLAPPGPSGGRSRMLTGREQLAHPLLLCGGWDPVPKAMGTAVSRGVCHGQPPSLGTCPLQDPLSLLAAPREAAPRSSRGAPDPARSPGQCHMLVPDPQALLPSIPRPGGVPVSPCQGLHPLLLVMLRVGMRESGGCTEFAQPQLALPWQPRGKEEEGRAPKPPQPHPPPSPPEKKKKTKPNHKKK